MKAFACKPLKLSSNKVLVLGSIKGAKEPEILTKNGKQFVPHCSPFPVPFLDKNSQQEATFDENEDEEPKEWADDDLKALLAMLTGQTKTGKQVYSHNGYKVFTLVASK